VGYPSLQELNTAGLFAPALMEAALMRVEQILLADSAGQQVTRHGAGCKAQKHENR
jgi:hypothetical protein